MPSTIAPARRSVPRRALAAAVMALFTAAGCGASATEVSETDRSITTVERRTTTSSSGRSTTTTTKLKDRVSDDDLRALLPTAAEVGPDYRVAVDDDDEDDEGDDAAFEAAMRSACPDAAEFMEDASDENESDIGQEFETDDDRTIEVTFNPDPKNLGEADLNRVIDVINGCGTVEVEQGEGLSMALDFDAVRDDRFGDRGMTMTMEAELSSPYLKGPLTLGARLRVFVVGPVSVSINAGDGLDDETFGPVPGDYDLVDVLSAGLETELDRLLD